MKKVYLAGPEVFLRDSIETGNLKKALCEKYGFIGLYPLDNELESEGRKPVELGLEIARANEALIAEADAVIANLTPFRGTSADVGTVYEIGLAKGLGKVVLGYSNDARNFLTRNCEDLAAVQEFPEGEFCDGNGMTLENFGLVDNLMIDGGVSAPIILNQQGEGAQKYRELAGFEKCLINLVLHYECVSC